jgi:hypothetical protein
MFTHINIATWNATGIISSGSYLNELLLLHDIDVIGISEHWLYRSDLHFLNSINTNYTSFSVSDPDLDLPSNRRVGKGGIGIMWKKEISHLIFPVETLSQYIIGVELTFSSDQHFYLFQTYIPCKNHSIKTYKESIEEVENVLQTYHTRGKIILLGDFNVELPSRSVEIHDFRLDSRGKILASSLVHFDLIPINTLSICGGSEFSHVPYNGTRETLLDYIFLQSVSIPNITSCQILDDSALNVSSHRPLLCSIRLNNTLPGINPKPTSHIVWHNVRQTSIDRYTQFMENDTQLQEIANSNITNITDIDSCYNYISQIINKANANIIPKPKFKKYLKPYWTASLTTLHKEMINKRHIWINNKRPRDKNTKSYRDYKQSKSNFRRHHRVQVTEYLRQTEADLDKYAEIDSIQFWKIIKSRRKSKQCEKTHEIRFNDNLCKTPQTINEGWKDHFKSLYSVSDVVSESDAASDEYYSVALRELSDFNSRSDSLNKLNIHINIDNLTKALKTCKKNKACGPDLIYYENIMYGGNALIQSLHKMYQSMINTGYCPAPMKRGTISVLFKGGNKRKDDPHSYRAISLCSTVLKLYEKILVQVLDNEHCLNFNPLQGGFQPNTSCTLTSFLARECIYFCKENNSQLYACYLDAKQAFDHVDFNLLILKLYKMNFNINIIRIIESLLSEIKSCVKTSGVISDWFPISKGARQGQVLSATIYLVYINDLLNELDRCKFGLKINSVGYSCPTVADDMLLLSLTPEGLQSLIDLCYNNSKKEKYAYNPSKCKVVVYNENNANNALGNNAKQWNLGENMLDKTSSYNHLGIINNDTLDLKENVVEGCSKLRRTFYSLIDVGLNSDRLHPLTMKKLYLTVVIPKALYGSELWNGLNNTQLAMLEKSHKQCVKRIQGMPKYTNTTVALSCLSLYSIETLIDERKLLFFGQLCNAKITLRIKTIFIHRLLQYMNNPRSAVGFMPDIYRIFCKYKLSHILNRYISDSSFPTANSWKSMVKAAIKLYVNEDFKSQIASQPHLELFFQIHSEYIPSFLWHFSSLYREQLDFCLTAMNVLSRLHSRQFPSVCQNCLLCADNLAAHVILFCPATDHVRNELWKILHTSLGMSNYSNLLSMPILTQVQQLLAGFPIFEMKDSLRIKTFKITLRYIHKLANRIRYQTI